MKTLCLVILILQTSLAHAALLFGEVFASGAGYCPLPPEPGRSLRQFSSDKGYVAGTERSANQKERIDTDFDGVADSRCSAHGAVNMNYDRLQAGTTTKATWGGLVNFNGRASAGSAAAAYDELFIDTSALPPGTSAELEVIRVVGWSFKGLSDVDQGNTYLVAKGALMLEAYTSTEQAGFSSVFCAGIDQNGCDELSPRASGSRKLVHHLSLPQSPEPSLLRLSTNLVTQGFLDLGGGRITGTLMTAGKDAPLPTARVYLKLRTPGVQVSAQSGTRYDCPDTEPACH